MHDIVLDTGVPLRRALKPRLVPTALPPSMAVLAEAVADAVLPTGVSTAAASSQRTRVYGSTLRLAPAPSNAWRLRDAPCGHDVAPTRVSFDNQGARGARALSGRATPGMAPYKARLYGVPGWNSKPWL